MYDYVLSGYWLVLPYAALRGHPLLKIAPTGMVPQQDRRPRPIMDYTYNNINQTSIPLAPQHAMQFGTVLQRILQHLAYANPAYGPLQLAKLDLADGYYRVPLNSNAALELAVALLPDAGSGPLLGIPLSLPMGWYQSPPYFCSFTGTCADLANTISVPSPSHPYPHVLEPTQDLPPPNGPLALQPLPPTQPLSFTDVYLDDFMVLAQGPCHHTMDNLLHHIHSVFCDAPSSTQRAIISASKVQKGDATFSTTKRVLGWDLDMHRMQIHLPTHHCERLQELLSKTLQQKFSTRRRWQRLLGELRSMAFAIHSAKYLFSILQSALQRATTRRFHITAILRAALHDW